MCLVLSYFAETSPSGSLCPFQSKRWSLKGGSWDACFSKGCCMRINLFLIIKAERTSLCVSLFKFTSSCAAFLFSPFHPPIFYFHLSSCLYIFFPQWVGSCRKTLTDQWKVMRLLSRWSAVEAVSCALVYCVSVLCWAIFFWISSPVPVLFQWPAVAAFNPSVLPNLLVFIYLFFFTELLVLWNKTQHGFRSVCVN